MKRDLGQPTAPAAHLRGMSWDELRGELHRLAPALFIVLGAAVRGRDAVVLTWAAVGLAVATIASAVVARRPDYMRSGASTPIRSSERAITA